MGKVNLWLDDEDVDRLLSILTDEVHHSDKQTPEFKNAERLMLLINGQRRESPQFVEKATEYQQVCALLCQDVDVCYEIAHSTTNPDGKKLQAQIDLLHEHKQDMITNKESRERRYAAALALYSLPPGAIRSDRIG